MAQDLSCAVVIPCFNPDFEVLKRAVESVIEIARIECQEVAVILVDDCSSEAKGAQYLPILNEVPNAVFIQLDQNVGPGLARNAGIEFALAKMKPMAIGFLDADDEFLAGWTRALEPLAKDPAISVISCGFLKNGKPFGTSEVNNLGGWKNGPFTRVSSIFVRSSELDRTKSRFLPERIGEDTEFIWRLVLYEGWRHLPIAVSSYNYDFKDHLTYPHPLFKSCEADAGFRRAVSAAGLISRVIRTNERNGLLLRRIRPWQARQIPLAEAIFQYLLGKSLRKFGKFARKVIYALH